MNAQVEKNKLNKINPKLYLDPHLKVCVCEEGVIYFFVPDS